MERAGMLAEATARFTYVALPCLESTGNQVEIGVGQSQPSSRELFGIA